MVRGTIIAHSDAAGAVTQKNAYDPYGIPKTTNQGRFGYTGQTWIKELGLNYYKARMYSPKIGRFLQTDPIFYKDDMNLYAYAHNDPRNNSDPFGLEVFASYDLRTQRLTVMDMETRETVTGHAESGGKPWGDPIEMGDYEILDHPDYDFLRLEPLDSNYGDDIHEATGRDVFRLHRPGRTIGCIAVSKGEIWKQAARLIRNTKSGERTVKSKTRNPFSTQKTEQIRYFGQLTVWRSSVPPEVKPHPKRRPKRGTVEIEVLE